MYGFLSEFSTQKIPLQKELHIKYKFNNRQNHLTTATYHHSINQTQTATQNNQN